MSEKKIIKGEVNLPAVSSNAGEIAERIQEMNNLGDVYRLAGLDDAAMKEIVNKSLEDNPVVGEAAQVIENYRKAMHELVPKQKKGGFIGFMGKLPLVGKALEGLMDGVEEAKDAHIKYGELSSSFDIVKGALVENFENDKEFVNRNKRYLEGIDDAVSALGIEEERLNQALESLSTDENDQMAMIERGEINNKLNMIKQAQLELENTKNVVGNMIMQVVLQVGDKQALFNKMEAMKGQMDTLVFTQLMVAKNNEQIITAHKAIDASRDSLNNLLQINSETLRNATLKTVEATNRTTISIETVREVSKNLQATITESAQLAEKIRKENLKNLEEARAHSQKNRQLFGGVQQVKQLE